MIQATKPTFSFGILFLIALGLVGAVYYLNQELQNQMILLPVVPQHQKIAKTPVKSPLKAVEPAKPLSTENWQIYTDQAHAVSFKYPENWQVKTYSRTGYDIISIIPNQGLDNIRIYVSPTEYIGIAGLKTSTVTVGGVKGVSASDMVIGVKKGTNFFTFDAGQDQQLAPQFDGIIQTVAFNK